MKSIIYIFIFLFHLLIASNCAIAQTDSNHNELCLTFRGEKINCSDSNHIKNGYWMYFTNSDPNGFVYAEGLYKNGIKSGKWTYRKWNIDYSSSRTVTYSDNGDIAFEMDNGTLIIKSDSTLAPDYSNCPRYIYKTWCHKCFGSNYYDCLLFNNRNQTPATYEKKKVLGLVNAINEILMSNSLSEIYLNCILERKSDYFLAKWHQE